MNMLKEDNGKTSTTRIGYFIKLGVGIATLAYAIYTKYMPMELVIVICSLFGLNTVEKLINKRLEK